MVAVGAEAKWLKTQEHKVPDKDSIFSPKAHPGFLQECSQSILHLCPWCQFFCVSVLLFENFLLTDERRQWWLHVMSMFFKTLHFTSFKKSKSFNNDRETRKAPKRQPKAASL